jgi:hypothetical protein
MPREHEAYRDNYEALLEHFGRGHAHLSQKDVSDYLGLDPRTVRKIYGVDKSGIALPTLARKMCKN